MCLLKILQATKTQRQGLVAGTWLLLYRFVSSSFLFHIKADVKKIPGVDCSLFVSSSERISTPQAERQRTQSSLSQ